MIISQVAGCPRLISRSLAAQSTESNGKVIYRSDGEGTGTYAIRYVRSIYEIVSAFSVRPPLSPPVLPARPARRSRSIFPAAGKCIHSGKLEHRVFLGYTAYGSRCRNTEWHYALLEISLDPVHYTARYKPRSARRERTERIAAPGNSRTVFFRSLRVALQRAVFLSHYALVKMHLERSSVHLSR